MPALTLIVSSTSLGLLLCWSARTRQGSELAWSSGTWPVVLYALLVHAPISAAVLLLNPDWAFAYWVGPGRFQTLLVLATSLAVAGALPIGFLFGAKRARLHAGFGPLLWAAALLLPCGINTMLFMGPLTKDASYVEYQNDFGVRSLAGSSLGYSLIWAAVTDGMALFFTHRALRQIAHEHEALGEP